jgi:hypothetical protein
LVNGEKETVEEELAKELNAENTPIGNDICLIILQKCPLSSG